MNALMATAMGGTMYLSLFRITEGASGRRLDSFFVLGPVLQLSLYFSSIFMTDFTHFNLYFALDFAMTICLALTLFLRVREVKAA